MRYTYSQTRIEQQPAQTSVAEITMTDTSKPHDLRDDQRRVADELGIPHTQRHIFLCCDQTKPKCCAFSAGGRNPT